MIRRACMAMLMLLMVTGAGWLERADVDVDAGNRAFASGEYHAAVASYQRAAARDEDPRILLNLGLAWYRIGISSGQAQAVESFSRADTVLARAALTADGRIASLAMTARGNLHAQRGQLDDAIASFAAAVRADPSNHEARHNLEVALLRKKESERSQPSSAESTTDEQVPEPGPSQAPPQLPPAPPSLAASSTSESGNSLETELEIEELSRKLDALERRSRSLRRAMIGDRRISVEGRADR